MYRILLICLLFAACTQSKKENKYYFMIETTGTPEVDSFYARNDYAAYDSTSLRFQAIMESHRLANLRKPLSIQIFSDQGKDVLQTVPLEYRQRRDSLYTAIYRKLDPH